jgi:hypothetical protein
VCTDIIADFIGWMYSCFVGHLHPPLTPSIHRPQVQSGFYVAGAGHLNWTVLMRQMMQEIHGNTTNVATYIGPGYSHCGDSEVTYWTTTVRFFSQPC